MSEGTPIDPFAGNYPEVDADPTLVQRFITQGFVSPGAFRALSPEAQTQLRQAKYMPVDIERAIPGMFKMGDYQRMALQQGKVEVSAPRALLEEAEALYGTQEELKRKFLEETGFCGDREGEVIAQFMEDFVFRGERTVGGKQLWQQLKASLIDGNGLYHTSEDHGRELVSGFAYVLDRDEMGEEVVARVWPYIAVNRHPIYELIPDGMEDDLKTRIKSVGGKPWRIAAPVKNLGTKQVSQALTAYIAK